MTTAKVTWTISTMCLAPATTADARPTRETDRLADVMNPFARRPRGGQQLPGRERAGLLVIFAAVVAFMGVVLF